MSDFIYLFLCLSCVGGLYRDKDQGLSTVKVWLD